jgi:hypothetical protein
VDPAVAGIRTTRAPSGWTAVVMVIVDAPVGMVVVAFVLT